MKPESEPIQGQARSPWQPLCQPDPEGHCPTCADEAVVATVLSVDEEAGMACVSLGLAEAMIDTTLLGTVRPGDCLLVHGGVALERLDKPADRT
ncbi:HypC/HybG/HupF family hydrogenase formation chaperone [Thermogemmatispora sp.]|uniref:HypC/HybG/HupF family hydrogenase formation chaperone n=1 Tax=Thermogemmatispora sp. TaxID=1968838 RepID=UPI0035E45D01